MKKFITTAIFIILFASLPVPAAGETDIATLFPDIPGMSKGKVEIYNPDTLYEYINGAADVFLSYDFVQLAALTYKDKLEHTLTIDIYRHSSDRNGFGIYSQEKPIKGDFLLIGAQGYYEKGVLNFLKGNYYIKMSGFDLGEKEKTIMTTAAREIAGRIGGSQYFPLPVTCFPGKGKIKNSEKYIAQDFLGHSFLHSAFAAEYEEAGEKFQVFIIEAADTGEAKKILADYIKFAKSKGSEVSLHNTFSRFLDPYYSSGGKMNIEARGRFVFGLFGDKMSRVHYYMGQTASYLGRLHSSLK